MMLAAAYRFQVKDIQGKYQAYGENEGSRAASKLCTKKREVAMFHVEIKSFRMYTARNLESLPLTRLVPIVFPPVLFPRVVFPAIFLPRRGLGWAHRSA